MNYKKLRRTLFLTYCILVCCGSLDAAGTACTKPAPNRGFIYGTVLDVQGQNAIVQLPAASTCANSFYYCGDMRKTNTTGTDEFFGIIKAMTDLGNNKFSIFNDCPFKWPPNIGEQVFLYFKTCDKNFCPTDDTQDLDPQPICTDTNP